MSVLAGGFAAPRCGAATTVWNANLNFSEFAGQAGGFEAGTGILQNGGVPGPVERGYDVLRPTGTDPATGMAAYGKGQDGVADVFIRSTIYDQSGGRWDSVHSGKRPGGYTGGATIEYGTSRSGDSGLIVLEFRLAAALEVSADQFALSLTSANGTSAAYEWSMVTIGGIEDAPFSPAAIAGYGALDYNETGSGTYYNALGLPSGAAGTGKLLGRGRSISQYLSAFPVSGVSGGLVQPGWFALDDFNAHIFDGPEELAANPFASDGSLEDNVTIGGTGLGLPAEAHVQSFTVWIGYHDVAFDSDGDGFTATGGNPFVSVSQLSLGCTPVLSVIPEPGAAAFAVLLAGAGLIRHRR